MAEGDYVEAYPILRKLRGYKDVEELLYDNKELRDEYFVEGREVSFGRYEQDGDTDNGPEEIRWTVLDREGDHVLLLSEYCLDVRAFNEGGGDTTWEQSTIRSWLNSSFMDTAFTSEEQKAILKTEVDNSQAEGYSEKTVGGNNTEDQVFLLSYKEAFEDYFGSDQARRCSPTAYADQMPIYTYSGDCGWWLRSPSYMQEAVVYVRYDGSIETNWGASYPYIGIRPALWINLESDIF